MFRTIRIVSQLRIANPHLALRTKGWGYTKIAMSRHFCTLPASKFEDFKKTLDEKMQSKLNRIQIELSSNRRKVPQFDELSIEEFGELLIMSSTKRNKYYRYLFKSKSAKKNDNLKNDFKKAARQMEEKDFKAVSPYGKHIEYGLSKSSLFARMERRWTNKFQDLKIARAIMSNEPNIIFDCGFNETMSAREQMNTAKQLSSVLQENRSCSQPFVLHFCNLLKGSEFWGYLKKYVQNIERIPIRIHSGDITTAISPESLVYLTPDADTVLEEYNPMDCYVVGSIVDRGIRKPITLPKAQQLGIRTAQLPLYKLPNWNSHKELTLNEVMRIMISIRQSDDWNTALGFIAKRKSDNTEQEQDNQSAIVAS